MPTHDPHQLSVPTLMFCIPANTDTLSTQTVAKKQDAFSSFYSNTLTNAEKNSISKNNNIYHSIFPCEESILNKSNTLLVIEYPK